MFICNSIEMKYILAFHICFLLITGLNGHGREAWEAQFPFQASLRDNDEHLCSGAIIHTQIILTTASCLIRFRRTETFSVVVGSIHLNKDGERFLIDNFVYHKEFFYRRMLYDIGMVKTTIPIDFSRRVRPIPILGYEVPFGSIAVVSRWYTARTSGETVLHSDWLPTVNMDECNKIAGEFLRPEFGEGHICTFSASFGRECNYNVGDVLTYKRKLVGLLSSDFACIMNLPTVFTNVSYHINWITENYRKIRRNSTHIV